MMSETLINREGLPFAHGGVQNFGNRWIVSTTDRVEILAVVQAVCLYSRLSLLRTIAEILVTFQSMGKTRIRPHGKWRK